MNNIKIFRRNEDVNIIYSKFLDCEIFPLDGTGISGLPSASHIFICDYLYVTEATLLKIFIDDEICESFVLGLVDPDPETQVDWVEYDCYPVCEINKACSIQELDIILRTPFKNINYASINEFCESAFFFPLDMSWMCQVSTRFEAAIFWFSNEDILNFFIKRHKNITPFSPDALRERGIGFR